MILNNPITIQPPSFTRKTGEVRSFPPRVITELNFTIVDHAFAKVCIANIVGFPSSVPLWSGAEYDAAGDYTQAQAEARLLEKLGPDIKAGLENLFPKPVAQ